MKRVAKIFESTKSRLYFRQPVYVPSYAPSLFKKWLSIGAVTLLALFIIGAIFGVDQTESTNNNQHNTEKAQSKARNLAQPTTHLEGPYKIVKVVDGDTIDISINNKTERIRLIGMDTPETVDPRKTVECFGKEASNRAKILLTGKSVYIESDPSQDNRDKYDRLLRYVYFQDKTSYNKLMISEGYAHEYTYYVPYKYQAEYKKAQQDAEKSQAGLWSPNTCNGDTGVNSSPTTSQSTNDQMSETTKNTNTTSTSCNPNYTPCVPNVSYDLNCSDISFSVRVIGTDVYNFDRDGDGFGCESN